MPKQSHEACRGPTAASRAVQLHLASLCQELARIAPALEDRDPAIATEAVHDLRVTCQQMRSVLKAFSAWLPAGPAGRLEKRIHRLQRTFSELRDRQVLLEQPLLVPDLHRRLEQQQADAMGRLLASGGSGAICRKAGRLREQLFDPEANFGFNPEPLSGKGDVRLFRLDAIVPAVLYRQAAAVTAFRPFIPLQLPEKPIASGQDAPGRFWENPDWPSAAVLHRLRLAFKQFRHVLLMLCPLWGSLADSLAASCKAMQDRLGRLHDRQALAEALLAYWQEAGAEAPDLVVWNRIVAEQEADLRAFCERWQGMDLDWFHSRLQPLVGWSVQLAASAGAAAVRTPAGQHQEQIGPP